MCIALLRQPILDGKQCYKCRCSVSFCILLCISRPQATGTLTHSSYRPARSRSPDVGNALPQGTMQCITPIHLVLPARTSSPKSAIVCLAFESNPLSLASAAHRHHADYKACTAVKAAAAIQQERQEHAGCQLRQPPHQPRAVPYAGGWHTSAWVNPSASRLQ
jgi:hypothetical protein